jgi:hypothetical protein
LENPEKIDGGVGKTTLYETGPQAYRYQTLKPVAYPLWTTYLRGLNDLNKYSYAITFWQEHGGLRLTK